jgi:hypothetical protein
VYFIQRAHPLTSGASLIEAGLWISVTPTFAEGLGSADSLKGADGNNSFIAIDFKSISPYPAYLDLGMALIPTRLARNKMWE